MDQDENNSDLIRDYLLGALPEAEANRFEERFLGDEALFTNVQEIEEELIDDYACGALRAGHRALFETNFLDSSERREKLELAAALRMRAAAWAHEREAKQQATTIIGAPVTPGGQTFSNRILRLKPSGPMPSWFQWATLAASVLFAVLAGSLLFSNRELRRQLVTQKVNEEQLKRNAESSEKQKDEASKKAAEAETQVAKVEEEKKSLLERLPEEINKPTVDIIIDAYYAVTGSKGEGEKRVKTLIIPANAKQVRLSLAFPKSEFSDFQALLRHADHSPAGPPHAGLKARNSGGNQTLTFTIPAKTLSTGDYELIISGVTSDGNTEGVGRYYLRITPR